MRRATTVVLGPSILVVAFAALAALAPACAAPKVAKLVVHGDKRQLRERAAGTPASSPDKPPILYLAFDGVGRELLYDMLRKGKLPHLATLLGGAAGPSGSEFPHAHFDEHLLSTLPSSTMAAWATTMTGVGPAEHGITGNEFFIRETSEFACPAPVSFADSKPTIEIFTDGYMNRLSEAPSVYERMREKDPNLLAWVGMHDLYRGADELLLTKRAVLADAFEGAIEVEAKKELAKEESRRLYADLDKAVIETVTDHLREGPLPDVLTVYLSGTDLYAHIAKEGPDAARRSYLEEIVDPALAKLVDVLRARDTLAHRWVVLSADHGHTQVVHDDAHALSTKDDEDPPGVLKRSGFRVRPFSRNVSEKDDFSAVLAYGGATAYVYLARSLWVPAREGRVQLEGASALRGGRARCRRGLLREQRAWLAGRSDARRARHDPDAAPQALPGGRRPLRGLRGRRQDDAGRRVLEGASASDIRFSGRTSARSRGGRARRACR